MKGYYTGSNYMGYIPGKGYQKFETEEEYRNYYEELQNWGSFSFRIKYYFFYAVKC